MAHPVRQRRRGQGDAGETGIGPALHARDTGHGQTGGVNPVQPTGAQGIARLHIGVARHEAQLHPGIGAAARTAERRAALLRAGVDHRDGGVAVGQQRHLGRERVQPRHLPQHPGFVDHRRAAHHAMRGAPVDEDLAGVGVGRLVKDLGRRGFHAQRRAQIKQRTQLAVLGLQLLGALGLHRLARQGGACRRLCRQGLAQALQVVTPALPGLHRHGQRPLHRQQGGGQRGPQRIHHAPARVRHHQQHGQGRKQAQLRQRRQALTEERWRGAVQRPQGHRASVTRR